MQHNTDLQYSRDTVFEGGGGGVEIQRSAIRYSTVGFIIQGFAATEHNTVHEQFFDCVRYAELLRRPASVFHQEAKSGSPGPLLIFLQSQLQYSTAQYGSAVAPRLAQARILSLAMALTRQQNDKTWRRP